MKEMKVSVLMITYNHEKFIAQAIDSVLEQKANFDYEIVIGEDCSTDKTYGVCEEYMKRFPKKIKLLRNKNNIGMQKNFTQTFNACRGAYVAFLEGDDYWVDDKKLQKQVDYLDKDLKSSACFHNARIVYEGLDKKEDLFHKNAMKRYYDLKDIVSRFFIPSCSIMFRRECVWPFPGWFEKAYLCDWVLHILLAKRGYYGYMNEIMATYRIHKKGILSTGSRDDIMKKSIATLKLVKGYLKFRYRCIINIKILFGYCSLYKYYLTNMFKRNAK